eukprot:TRINITY_DN14010_c0_g1_i1.p1 TRINITY_DN14010_c0_g1~~TRINITY_DN14010_c0_g1_i1.p1  ORF type:complete len:127 (+),score=27.18 TRINITY_DN14010_c0_g1_i1:255-635(+)
MQMISPLLWISLSLSLPLLSLSPSSSLIRCWVAALDFSLSLSLSLLSLSLPLSLSLCKISTRAFCRFFVSFFSSCFRFFSQVRLEFFFSFFFFSYSDSGSYIKRKRSCVDDAQKEIVKEPNFKIRK